MDGAVALGKERLTKNLQNNEGNPLFDPHKSPGLKALSKMCHCSVLADFGAEWQLQFQFW